MSSLSSIIDEQLTLTHQELTNMTIETLNNTNVLCPITQDMIINKMTLSCGHCFEQSAILEWILNEKNDEGDSTCPTCRSIIIYNDTRIGRAIENNVLPGARRIALSPLRIMQTDFSDDAQEYLLNAIARLDDARLDDARFNGSQLKHLFYLFLNKKPPSFFYCDFNMYHTSDNASCRFFPSDEEDQKKIRRKLEYLYRMTFCVSHNETVQILASLGEHIRNYMRIFFGVVLFDEE